MDVSRPTGDPWRIEDAAAKLDLRASLPGAFVFDLATSASRSALAAGVSPADRLSLALPASWLVNSPAVSKVLQRWASGPPREVWLALLEVLEGDGRRWQEGKSTQQDEELVVALQALGSEDHIVESVSKVLALLVPDVVPLMPMPARTFVLGEARASTLGAFVAMIDWFTETAVIHEAELDAIARAHRAAPLSGAQVLDRLLWFDSEGHRHFAGRAPRTAATVDPPRDGRDG